MTAKTAILEINGERYEAHSGVWLAENQAAKSRPARSIDGMVAPANAHYDGLSTSPDKALHNIVTKPTMSDVVRPGANPLHKKQQSSLILMRAAVKKPQLGTITVIKSQSAISKLPAKKSNHKLQAKLSVANMDHMRVRRAEATSKSEKVAKFNKSAHPSHKIETPITPARTQLTPAVHHKHQNHSPKEKTTADIFEDALAHATSHLQAHHHHKKHSKHKKAGIIAASVAAFVMTTGLIASQNMGNAQMYLASSKAGFAAALPGYEPAGYGLNKINSNAGVVAANYVSNTDSRSYTVTQKPSKWDSPTLLSEYVKSNSLGAGDHYSVEKNGRTIYIFGNRHATWVSEGVWYDIKASAALSDRQLIDIAASL